MPVRLRAWALTGVMLALAAGCAPLPAVAGDGPKVSTGTPGATATPGRTPEATATPGPQPALPAVSYGPEAAAFPPGVNPLTGLRVADPDLLRQPALLVSIPHFPAAVRPQGGLSYAAWVFEYLIATGTTRLAAVFHGQVPAPLALPSGGCTPREPPFALQGLLLGNRVWYDRDGDGSQSPEEPGVGGVCVELLDAQGNRLQTTGTDSNGYFGFDVEAGSYGLRFVLPEGWAFTAPDTGYEQTDSDADATTGATRTFRVAADTRAADAGLVLLEETQPEDLPPAEIGPVRSARMIHIHLQNSLQDSCLIYAGSTKEIRGQIPGCATVFQKGDGGIGSMLPVSRMQEIAEQNARNSGSKFDYSGNLFSDQAPSGGVRAAAIEFFFSQLNQNKWVYDPAHQGWLRYVDNASEQTEFHADVDRLTGRQIAFENLLVLFVEHEVLAPLIIDMYMGQGEREDGLLFRDGRMYAIEWSTRSGAYEQQTGLRRPIAFLDTDGKPFPLRPGRSWIVVATPYSVLSEREPGVFKFRIYAPPGAGLY